MHLGEIGDCKLAHKRPNNRHFMPNSARIAGNPALDFGSWALIGFAFCLKYGLTIDWLPALVS
jgi:hypothetical protein